MRVTGMHDGRTSPGIGHIIRAALRDMADDLFVTAVVNLLWLILTLLIVTAPPAIVALFYVGNRKAHGEVTEVSDFFFALRHYFWPAWRWGLVNVIILLFLWGDVVLTGYLSQSAFARFAQGFYLILLVIWLFLQLYALALMFEQEQPSLRLAWRNAAVMLGQNVGFSLALAAALVLVLLVSTLFFLVIMAAGGILVALIANHAVLNRLQIDFPGNSEFPGK
ncbi:MAG: DUF624 domain-containing protein [Anaerolineae bacterium]|nr:DUF624 domain-containing protein [Anaerolineae bacterium]